LNTVYLSFKQYH